MRPFMIRIVLLALVVGAVTAACDQPETNVPVGPSPAAITSVQIIGPTNVPPSTPTQYTANVQLSNGTVKATAAQISWRSSNTSVLQVNPSGLVTPVASQGEATITATVNQGNANRQSSRELIIMPTGTFRVVGKVTEAGAGAGAVVGARVDVESGSPFAITDSFGNYRLYGVPPSATLRISAPDYDTVTVPVQLSGNVTRNVGLTFTGNRPNLGGNYTLTITALGTCNAFPAEFRNRQYDAVLTQTNSTVEVTLTAPSFRLSSAGRGNRFSGTVTSNGAVFSLTWPDSYYYYYYYNFYSPGGYPNLVESVSNNRYLVTRGNFTTVGSPAGLTGSVFGAMTLWDSNFPGTRQRLLSSCYGNTQLRLDPR